jgi:hypothetical protein
MLLLPVLLSACGGGGGGGDTITLTTDSQGADPVVLEIPIAYIKRPIPLDPPDLRDPLDFYPGARLIFKERSAVSAEETDVTEQMLAIVAEEEGVTPEELEIDIKGLESSYDGKTLVFAARVVPMPVDANLELTTWNLWLFDVDELQAKYLIDSRIKRNEGMEAGGGQDIDPHFLGDDRIVFSSTRQVASQARQLNEGRIQIFSALDEDRQEPSAVLHIYDPLQRDAEFKQISFNLSHDLEPVVLSSGEIVFSRWNNTTTDHISLFKIMPHGSGLSPLYGFHSQDIGTDGTSVEFTQVRELDSGDLISVIKPFAAETFGGQIAVIDAETYAEIDQSTWDNPGQAGPGQVPLTATDVRTDDQVSPGGQFGYAYPLRDGTDRLLVTWSECRVIDAEDGELLPCTLDPENTVRAPPLYGAWIYDPTGDTQRPVVRAEEGFLISEVIAAEPRDYPSLPAQALDFDPELALRGKGRILIKSVYDIDGVDSSPMGIANHAIPGTQAYDERPARFLRVVTPVPIPDRDIFEIPRFAGGVAGRTNFREIQGYVPIEPDGSVTATVPAEQPFRFSILDKDGRRIGSSHNHWLQVAPGEVLQCTGCHTRGSTLPHGRLDSQPISANPGATDLPTGGAGFPGTDTNSLFATTTGESMAEVWDFHRPLGNEVAAAREIDLHPKYIDEWTSIVVQSAATNIDLSYEAWPDIPLDKPIIVNNLDPTLPSRIVINYIDHIQPIWERVRTPLLDGAGNLVDSCIGCHSSQSDTVIPAGQLDLESVSSDIDPDHYRSYRELLNSDAEQWIDLGGNVADRLRVCTDVDVDGNILTFTNTLSVRSTMRGGSANGSSNFFDCFEGGSCGPNGQPPLPANCTEDGGTIVPATNNTVDHNGLLSPSELRLISEWLDIGAQYYNNPFDPRLL